MNDFVDVLKAVTVDCKDNGKEFTVTDRVTVIEHLLKGTDYRVIAREPLSLIYAKCEFSAGDSVVLVSSHIDCLYDACSCDGDGDYLRGTFDNSVGNAAILFLMIQGKLPDNVVVAFTGDEEQNSQGAVQTVIALAAAAFFAHLTSCFFKVEQILRKQQAVAKRKQRMTQANLTVVRGVKTQVA